MSYLRSFILEVASQGEASELLFGRKNGFHDMSFIGHTIKGSPLDRWLFSDPPQVVLQSPETFGQI